MTSNDTFVVKDDGLPKMHEKQGTRSSPESFACQGGSLKRSNESMSEGPLEATKLLDGDTRRRSEGEESRKAPRPDGATPFSNEQDPTVIAPATGPLPSATVAGGGEAIAPAQVMVCFIAAST